MIQRVFTKMVKLSRRNWLQSKELEWAHVYHDSIRGTPWLESLQLNVGRWAGSYALFYILNRVLKEHRPGSIVEFGLGESTKFISAFLDHELPETTHLAIEQSDQWRTAFCDRSQLNDRVTIDICELMQKEVQGHASNCYQGIEKFADRKFDFYIVDGPFGSDRFSRFDMVRIAENLTKEDQFIFLIDDYERKGEAESAEHLIKQLEKKGCLLYTSPSPRDRG